MPTTVRWLAGGGTPVSRWSRATMVDQELQSATARQQRSKLIITGFMSGGVATFLVCETVTSVDVLHPLPEKTTSRLQYTLETSIKVFVRVYIRCKSLSSKIFKNISLSGINQSMEAYDFPLYVFLSSKRIQQTKA
jgi:hypothetical protein